MLCEYYLIYHTFWIFTIAAQENCPLIDEHYHDFVNKIFNYKSIDKIHFIDEQYHL
jgi:hypothetical protein